jgi:prepilin-type N-terminal cleavage/methylation domain-containing protein
MTISAAAEGRLEADPSLPVVPCRIQAGYPPKVGDGYGLRAAGKQSGHLCSIGRSLEVKKLHSSMRCARKGFTLLEALFAVLIVAVLAAVAVPMYTNTRAQAQHDTCLSNIRAIASAEAKYKFENGGYIDNTTDQLVGQGLATTPKCPTGAAYKIDTSVAGQCTITCLDGTHKTDATLSMTLK